MEYGTESNTNMKFFTFFDGSIVTREQEGTPGAVSREIQKGQNAGKLVWELTHNYISGTITGGGIEIKEFGAKKVPEIQVILDNEGMLQIPMYMLSAIAEVLPNLNRTEPVKFRTYKTKRDKVVLDISQGGTKLESNFVDWSDESGKWTPTYKNGLPAPVYDEIDGWDFRDHDKFLKKVVIDFFADYTLEKAGFTETPDVPVEDEDDVPF